MAQEEDFIDPYEFLGIAPESRSPEMSDVPSGGAYQDPYEFLGIAPGTLAARTPQALTQGRPNDWNYGKQIVSGLTLGFGPELYGTQKYIDEGGPMGPLSLSQNIYNQTQAQEAFERENYLNAKPIELISSVPTTVAANALTPGLSTLARSPSIAARLGAGALAGAETGALQTRITGGDIGENALMGGLLQGGMPGASAAAGRMLLPKVAPGVADTVRDMERLGIKLRPAQVAMSEALRRSDELLAGKANQQQLRDFTRAVNRTYGEDTTEFTPQVMNRAYKRITGDMDSIAQTTNVSKTKPFVQRVAIVGANLKGLPTEAQKEVREAIRELNKAFDSKGNMNGKIYQRVTAKGGILMNLASAKHPDVRNAGKMLREALDDAMEASSPPGTRARWDDVRAQFRNLTAVQPLVEGNVSGVVNPQALHGQVKKVFSEYGWDDLPYEMNTLAEGGRLMARANVTGDPKTTSNQRWYLRSGTILPVGAGMGEMMFLSGNPVKAAIVTGATAGTLEAAKMSRGAILGSDWYRNALTGNVSAPSLSGRAVRNTLTGAVNALTNQFEGEEE